MTTIFDLTYQQRVRARLEREAARKPTGRMTLLSYEGAAMVQRDRIRRLAAQRGAVPVWRRPQPHQVAARRSHRCLLASGCFVEIEESVCQWT